MNQYECTRRIETQHYTIELFEAENRGYFEHHRLGDNKAGELLFEWEDGKRHLIDYDGVVALPREVGEALRAAGIEVSEDCF